MLRAFTAVLVLATITPAAPVPKGIKSNAPPVAGTTWVGLDAAHGRVEYTFEVGGRLVYTYGGSTFRNGTWEQTGSTLTWETNDRYAEYTLRFRDGGFEGTAKNVKDKTWAVELLPRGAK